MWQRGRKFPAKEVVTRRHVQTFVFFRIHLEETKVFFDLKHKTDKTRREKT